MRFIINILILALPFSALAQMETYLAEPNDREADSLHTIFKSTTSDTVKLEVSRMLGFYYHEKNTDSALFFQTQQLEMAQKLRFRLWEADALELCGFISKNMGRYPVSLQYFQKALRITEDSKSEQNSWKPEILSKDGTPQATRLTIRSFIFLDMASLYRSTGDIKKESNSYLKSIKIAKDLNDDIILSLAYGSYSETLFHDNNLDSSLFYSELAVKHTLKSGYLKYYSGTLSNIAMIYLKQENYNSSRNYLKNAIRVAIETGNTRSLGDIYNDLSSFYLQRGPIDSSLYFARKSLFISQKTKLPRIELSAFKLLTQIYAKKGMLDSAFFYQNAAIASAESMTSEEKISHMQNLEFSEQLRLNELQEKEEKYQNKVRTRALISGLVLILVVAGILYRNSLIRRRAYKLLHKQRNEIQSALAELKNTQTQLIHSEKMASLGELTAGIAHEIQNPLNFVNNFSDVSVDLIEELNEELSEGNTEEVKTISQDLQQNLEKIHNHGKRASSIVKGMLEHSRAGNDKKQPTDINAMADEYIRLAYHGIRAKDNSFNVDFKADLDENLPKINVVGQDIARVVLNLINNAFHACAERSQSAIASKSHKTTDPNYKPLVTISTKKINGQVEISVKDNGMGIPENILDKIFQPFFTTKASGEGTGLGLSLSYDIITKGHGGELKVETEEGKGSCFIINLPIQ